MLAKVETVLADSDRIYTPKKNPKRKPSEKTIKNRKDRFATAAKTDAPKWQRFLRGLWLSGLRLGEAMALTWDDDSTAMVDLSGKRPMLLIRAACQKGQRDTLTPITPDFAELLLATPKDERHGRVFDLPRFNGRLTDVSRVISDIGEAAGVVADKEKGKFASAHDLRRSFGVRWAARVMPAILKDLMRHADINTTMKFYVGTNAQATADIVWKAFIAVDSSIDSCGSNENGSASKKLQTLED